MRRQRVTHRGVDLPDTQVESVTHTGIPLAKRQHAATLPYTGVHEEEDYLNSGEQQDLLLCRRRHGPLFFLLEAPHLNCQTRASNRDNK